MVNALVRANKQFDQFMPIRTATTASMVERPASPLRLIPGSGTDDRRTHCDVLATSTIHLCSADRGVRMPRTWNPTAGRHTRTTCARLLERHRTPHLVLAHVHLVRKDLTDLSMIPDASWTVYLAILSCRPNAALTSLCTGPVVVKSMDPPNPPAHLNELHEPQPLLNRPRSGTPKGCTSFHGRDVGALLLLRHARAADAVPHQVAAKRR